MKHHLTTFLFLFSFISAFAQNVTNVSFHQEGNKVIIMYDLDMPSDVSVYMSTNGGATFGSALQHVTGAVGRSVPAGTGKRIEYDALAEYDKLQGEDFVFKVVAGSCPTVTDYDGNVYNTVKIGGQCWMAENLRTTHYGNGTSIPQGSSESSTTGYWYYPDGNSDNKRTYGLLYNWPAVMHGSFSSERNPSGVQGICPKGWHVPSDAEWTQLTSYVKGHNEYVCPDCSGTDDEWTTFCIAKALASTTGWISGTNTCAVGNTPANNNATGFSAVPAGYCYGSYDYFGGDATFWSATQDSSGFTTYGWHLYYNNASVYRNNYGVKYYGFSVRCVRD